MTDEGQKILDAVRQLRGFHSDISLLLMTADSAMEELSWQNAKSDRTALYEQSYSITQPQGWMPWEVFRFYKNDTYPRLLASITVMIDDSQGRISEPLISGAVIEFGGDGLPVNFKSWLGGIFKALDRKAEDGNDFTATAEEIPANWHDGYERVKTFAFPLSEVTTEMVLRERVVSRVNEMAAQAL